MGDSASYTTPQQSSTYTFYRVYMYLWHNALQLSVQLGITGPIISFPRFVSGVHPDSVYM